MSLAANKNTKGMNNMLVKTIFSKSKNLKRRKTMMNFLFQESFLTSPIAVGIALVCACVCLCQIMKGHNHTLKLFQSQVAVSGGLANTSFSTTPTEITETNAFEFFRYDHTPILFKDGHSKGENYECATCISVDIDNSHSDNPSDWITTNDTQEQLQKLGIVYWIVASRNHLLSKDGKAPRPKFHLYLPLLESLTDSDKYVQLCIWCITTFGADPKVKSRAQKLFGFGDNPNAFVEHWDEGRCIDEVLADDDLTSEVSSISERKKTHPITSYVCPPEEGSTAFDWFGESGEWKNHLNDLEDLGWGFFEGDDRIYIQTPDGDHEPGKQDGNIKDGVVYFFSKAPAPFNENQGYSICQFFSGVLFGDIGKKGLGKFAKKYLRNEGVLSQDMPEIIGVPILDSFLSQVVETRFSESEGEKVGHSTYYVVSIATLLKTAIENHWDIGVKNGSSYFFTGEYWQRIDTQTFRHFLQAVGARQGIPYKVIRDHKFVDKLEKQFISEARFPILSANDTPKIGLRNGTLHFMPNGVEQKPFDKHDGLTYQLGYDFNPMATAPFFQKFLDRVLPDVLVQKLIFQYIGYVFLPKLNLEKVLFLYGRGANGKSVFLSVIKALIGNEQWCAYSLEGITKHEYQRAELGNFLINISTEISTRMGTDIFKKLASREPLQARQPYGKPFNVKDYATSIFAMNELPQEIEQTDAFFRRFIIIPFNIQIPDEEQDPDLASKIITSEMSGILNLVIKGAESLLTEGKFDIPVSIQRVIEDFRIESDTVAAFLEENGYRPSTSEHVPFGDMYYSYKFEYTDGVSRQVFSQRLRRLGYEIKKKGKQNICVVFATRQKTEDGNGQGGLSELGELGERRLFL